jgi:hypothetical protein
LAAKEWEKAQLEKQTAEKSKVAPVLMETATMRMLLLDFEAAFADLKTFKELSPKSPEATEMARDCAQALAAQSKEVLASPWKNCGPVLKTLKEKLSGYSKAVSGWQCPPRLPFVRNLAEDPQAWSGKDLEKDLAESKVVVDMIRLFVLHRSLPLSRVAAILGPDACKMLLEHRALTCYQAATAKLFEPSEALKLVPAGKVTAQEASALPEIFSNVMLWPVDEDLLVAVDFEQAMYVEGIFEPVPYVSQDSCALAAAAPRLPAAQALDACCGCGVQGLVALKSYAKKVTFLDSNARALQFATFSAYLNGLEENATFVLGSLSGPQLPKGISGIRFDAVLACLPQLPNPGSAVVTIGGPFIGGGADGDSVLSAVVAKATQELLAPGGRLVIASMASNAGSLAKRVVSWADGKAPADFRAVVFRGEPLRGADFSRLATKDLPAASRAAYLRGLQQTALQSVSPVVLLLRASAAGAEVPKYASRVETRPEAEGLWGRSTDLKKEVQAALEKLQGAAAALDGGEKAPETLYSLTWEEGE